jgi:hypothetical protein
MRLPCPFEVDDRRTPATGRERAAMGVMASECVNMSVTRPGAGLSMRGESACGPSQRVERLGSMRLTSGVLSRTPKPVPPVVSTRSTSASHHDCTTL